MASFKSQGDDVRIVISGGVTTAKTGGFYLSGNKLYFIQNVLRAEVPLFVNQASANGDVIIGKRKGEYEDCDKTTGEAWTVGQVLYWDPATSKFTTTAGSLKAVAEASTAQQSADTKGSVILYQ